MTDGSISKSKPKSIIFIHNIIVCGIKLLSSTQYFNSDDYFLLRIIENQISSQLLLR